MVSMTQTTSSFHGTSAPHAGTPTGTPYEFVSLDPDQVSGLEDERTQVLKVQLLLDHDCEKDVSVIHIDERLGFLLARHGDESLEPQLSHFGKPWVDMVLINGLAVTHQRRRVWDDSQHGRLTRVSAARLIRDISEVMKTIDDRKFLRWCESSPGAKIACASTCVGRVLIAGGCHALYSRVVTSGRFYRDQRTFIVASSIREQMQYGVWGDPDPELE